MTIAMQNLYESIGHKEYQSLGERAQERIAVQAQMNDPSWGGTREKFKQDFISYGRKYGLK